MAAEVSKPDFSFQWSSGGSIVAPSNVKIQTGWTAEVPPFQWENWSQNRQDNAILHLFQKGISEWDAASDYYFTTSGVRSYVQGSDGNIYVALQDSLNQNPVTATAYWAKAFSSPKGITRFTASGSFTVPANITTIWISGCAGGSGGSGGGGATNTLGVGGGGAGGGAGQSIIRQPFTVTPGQVIAITVGTAGVAGNAGTPGANGQSGGAGGSTIIGSLITLAGATGPGGGATWGGSILAIGAVPSGNGNAYPSGSYGNDGAVGSNLGVGGGGAGASSPFGGGGGGGRAGVPTGAVGLASVGFGSGGGGGGGGYGSAAGGSNGGSGGVGTPGLVIIEW